MTHTNPESPGSSERTSTEPVQPNYDWAGYGFDTRQVHAGEFDELNAGARVAPVFLTNGFRVDSFDETEARFRREVDREVYSRDSNPTNRVAEARIASLEGGTGAVLASSGQAAVSAALMTLLRAGEHFVSTASIYSGTRGLFETSFKRAGIDVDYVWDWTDRAEWEARIRPETKAVFVESIPNPKCDVVDVAFVAEIAHSFGLPVIVDNTVATPYLARPLEQGADVVVHSASKFLSGHGAVIAGVVVNGGTFDFDASPREFALLTDDSAGPSFMQKYGVSRAYEYAVRHGTLNNFGFALSPWNAFLLQQGIETLSLRMERHLESAHTIATWLEQHEAVESVDYAGLPSNPYYEVAKRAFGGRPGSVFSFTVRGGLDGARAVYDRVRVWSRMTNIGDVRSMILHPGTTTHCSFDDATRERLGIWPGLLRLSVGIETVDDLIADLDEALRGL